MGFWSWLTGRDSKQADVYAYYEKVDEVVSKIASISTVELFDAESNIKQAIDDLNNVKGVSEYIGTIQVAAFESVFEQIGDSIKGIGTQLKGKAEDIKTYEESSWWEKGLSTFTMITAKATEGVLSAIEDIGDGIVGWIASKDSGLEKACTRFVEKELSHDALNFYYNSSFAKKSFFTEESGLAAEFKLSGTIAAYYFSAGILAGASAGGAAASAGTKVASAVAKGASVASKIGSSTTLAATAIGLTAGIGSGTESGLRKGMDINEAFAKEGIKQGVIQGGLAFVGGKAGEKLAANAQIKAAQQAVDKADDVLASLEGDVSTHIIRGAEADLANAQANLKSLQSMKLFGSNSYASGGFQGYTDAITKAGMQLGEHPIATTQAALKTVTKGASTVMEVGKETMLHPIKTVSNIGSKAVSAVKTAPNAVTTVVKAAPGAVSSAVKAAPSVVAKVATSPITPVAIGVGAGAALSTSNSNANAQFRAEQNDPTNPRNMLPTNENINGAVTEHRTSATAGEAIGQFTVSEENVQQGGQNDNQPGGQGGYQGTP